MNAYEQYILKIVVPCTKLYIEVCCVASMIKYEAEYCTLNT